MASSLTEAERKFDLHIEIRDKLVTDVLQKVKQWQKENYHKKMISFKETIEAEDGFKKAQKPWAKLLSKVNSSRKAYHSSCKLEKSAINQENNAKEDPGLSPDQIKKLHDKVEKAKQDKVKTKEKYERALHEINQYNPRYMEDMSLQFDKMQNFEATRLKFFKEILSDIHKCLDLSSHANFSRVFSNFIQTVQNADAEKDLRWWKNTHGTGMSMNWPAFEEYSEELHSISSKRKNRGNVGGGEGVMLTSASYNPSGSQVSNSSVGKEDSGIHPGENEYFSSQSQNRFNDYNTYTQSYSQPSPEPDSTTSHDVEEPEGIHFKMTGTKTRLVYRLEPFMTMMVPKLTNCLSKLGMCSPS
ncbi:protein kinase C and casein kinase substrate in neurons protein 2-like [Saccoglossus kowalevskii]